MQAEERPLNSGAADFGWRLTNLASTPLLNSLVWRRCREATMASGCAACRQATLGKNLRMPGSRSSQANAVGQRSSPRAARARGSPRDTGDFPVVGIGASAGGLEACRKFIDGLSAGTGMAFILVQHLDPTHESMMVDLLTGHTSMTVQQATDGMRIERDQLYVIPPGNLSVCR